MTLDDDDGGSAVQGIELQSKGGGEGWRMIDVAQVSLCTADSPPLCNAFHSILGFDFGPDTA